MPRSLDAFFPPSPVTDLTIILRSLRVRLFSTATTVLSVAVAVALLLVLLLMRDASHQAFARGGGNMHLLVSRDSSPLVSVLNGIFYANPPPRPITWAEYERITGNLPLEYAIPTQQGDSYLGQPVLATLPNFFTDFQPGEGETWQLAAGRFLRGPTDPAPEDAGKPPIPEAHAFEVVVGSAAAKATGLRLGDTLHLTHGTSQSRQLGDPNAMQPHVHREFTYRVVGVLKPTGTPHDRALITHLDGGWIIHAHDRRKIEDPSIKTTTMADLLERDKLITGIYLRVLTRRGSDVSASLPPVFAKLRSDPTITVAQPLQQMNTLFRIIGNVDWILRAMAVVVLVSSGVGIMLALYNSMTERRRQIAVLRVLGCTQGRVFSLVVTEAAMIGLAGAVAGVVLALVGVQVVAQVLRREIGLSIPPALAPELVLTVCIGAVLLAALAGVVPALLAYRTPVANNLKPIG